MRNAGPHYESVFFAVTVLLAVMVAMFLFNSARVPVAPANVGASGLASPGYHLTIAAGRLATMV